MDGFSSVQAHAAVMIPLANFRIWPNTLFHRIRGGFQLGPIKCSSKKTAKGSHSEYSTDFNSKEAGEGEKKKMI